MSNNKTNILFLDIDGVLCVSRLSFDRLPGVLKRLDPIGIDFLNRLCEKTNTKIVMSSTWRLSHLKSEFKSFAFTPLLTAGLKYQYVYQEDPLTRSLIGIRGTEIQDWLDRNKHNVDKYVILDDDSDMLESQMSNFVKTDRANGISFQNMRDILEILGYELSVLKT